MASLVSCQDAPEELTQLDFDRIFTPSGLSVLPLQTTALVSWNLTQGASEYLVQVSRDSLEFTTDLKEYTTEDLFLNLTELIGSTQYSVRVMAISPEERPADSRWNRLAFKTQDEQLLHSIPASAIKSRQVTITWVPDPNVNRLVLTPAGGSGQSILLDEADIEAAGKTITGLTPGTGYTIGIYFDQTRRGRQTFTTKWVPDCNDPNVLCLGIGDNLRDAIGDPYNAGKLIFLPEGYTYTWGGGQQVAGGFTIYGDPDGDRPVITLSAGAPFVLNGLTSGNDVIRFENVELVSTHASGYLINQGTDATANACHIKSLTFENCRLADFGRSIIRTQAPNEKFDIIRINNCLIENCSKESGQNYAIIQSTVAFEAFPNIEITNTTVNHSYASFLSLAGGSLQPSGKNILIENVTFYKTVGSNSATPDNRYLIDGGNNGPLNITIKNCILGSVRGVGNERGFRMKVDGRMTAEDNYATTDWTTVADGEATPPILNIPTKAYNGSATTLFVDPANGDFRIKDASFAGKATAGDPRWR
jgi:hypothetical protein